MNEEERGAGETVMPRTRSLAWAELKIGLISIFAVAMSLVLIFLLAGEGGFSWQQYRLKTVFDNIAGLKPGAPVRVAGVEVGSVDETQFRGNRVEVVMKVNEKHIHLITTDSVATLGSVSLLGEAAVDITAAGHGTPIPEWGYVKSGSRWGRSPTSPVRPQRASNS
jgi:phospholipid/cholesterol/gamma-HCH transport system substrate-binding protein